MMNSTVNYNCNTQYPQLFGAHLLSSPLIFGRIRRTANSPTLTPVYFAVVGSSCKTEAVKKDWQGGAGHSVCSAICLNEYIIIN
jgi:hypothetical protein